MSLINGAVWLQISAGQGPIECAWAVMKVLEEMQKEAKAAGIDLKAIGMEPGPAPNTAYSILLSIPPHPARDCFINAWRGIVQWIARSPFRPEHKRKNWFVGIEIMEPAEKTRYFSLQIMRNPGKAAMSNSSGVMLYALRIASIYRSLLLVGLVQLA
jgi:peptide chain release factor